ncbi:MAG TPA: hypothetical protein VE988_14965, partial [Gemmataceae bacterium]|nr:hypothetical protein [Gemmataceae bacterium]
MAPTHILRRGRSGEALGSAKTRLVIELLESRLLLASYSPLYIPLPDPGQMAPAWRASPSLAWYTPQQIKHAYGIDLIRFTNGTVVGDGTGMTIAIVDAYDHPNIVNDLHAFDQQFGLPDPPLVKVNQVGDSAHLPAPAPPSTPTIAGWGEEAALDVEWAHAIAPKAKILLVEADDDSLTNFNAAVEYASTATGVVVVSMSFGDIEDPLETQDDSLYQTPSGHGGVTFVASAGDDGAPPIYPAISPNVLAVGGTTIDLDAAGNILSEIGWTGSGGGISAVESQPSYQSSLVIHNGPSVISANGMRTNPDVGYSSDGSAGFPIYDSYDSPAGSPWERLGGTSAAAPQWAALIAIADQGRALHGLGSLDGPSETLPKLYALPTSFFHDITTGDSTGTPNYTAGNGYDLVTGLGSPRADAVVAALVGLSVISSSPAVGSTVTVAPVSYTVNFSDFVNTASLQASDFTVDGAAADQVTLNPAGLAATFTFNTNPVTSQGSHVMHIGVGAIVKQGDASTTIQDFTGSFQFAPPVQAATHFTVSAPAATTAGNLFVFSVTAKDQFNNTATGYTGTVNITCGDSQAILSTDVTLAAGVGFFAALLRTAGTQTLTATDSVNTNLTGTSGPITVNAASLQYLGVSAPASAATGVAFGYTVRALDAYNNVIAGYGGTVHFTTTDSAANLPADSTLTNGIGSFSAVLSTAGNQILTATDKTTSSLGGSSNLITVRGLMVTSLTPTATGFVAAFNKPFDPATLNLYDSLATYGAADVTVVGPSGTVRGSLLIDSTNSSFTFIKTGIGVTGVFPGVLASGSYTVTFRSAANGFKGLDGGLLDGNGDGTSGDNYVTTFTPPASAGPVLSVPDFARGPNGAANIKVPQSGGTGIPITLSNPVAVTDVIFQLHYNPALLVITGTLSNTSGTFSLVGTASGGVANLSFHSNTALSANLTLGQIVAHVPDSAAANYKAKELLHLSDILINGATASVVNDDGVHVAAYVGDVSGDGALSPLDASLIARVAGLFDSGFAAYRLVDPAIVADISGNNFIDSSDVTLINRTVTGITVAQLPPIPTGLTISPTGPDPTLSLPTNLTAAPGTSVVVPLYL